MECEGNNHRFRRSQGTGDDNTMEERYCYCGEILLAKGVRL